MKNKVKKRDQVIVSCNKKSNRKGMVTKVLDRKGSSFYAEMNDTGKREYHNANCIVEIYEPVTEICDE